MEGACQKCMKEGPPLPLLQTGVGCWMENWSNYSVFTFNHLRQIYKDNIFAKDCTEEMQSSRVHSRCYSQQRVSILVTVNTIVFLYFKHIENPKLSSSCYVDIKCFTRNKYGISGIIVIESLSWTALNLQSVLGISFIVYCCKNVLLFFSFSSQSK